MEYEEIKKLMDDMGNSKVWQKQFKKTYLL